MLPARARRGLLPPALQAAARLAAVMSATTAVVAVVGSVGLMILTGFAGQKSLGHAGVLARGAYTIAGFDDDVFSQVRHSSSSMSHGLDLKSETCVQNDSF